MQSYIFSIITSVFSVPWSFRNDSNMLNIIFAAQETFIIINVENSYTAYYLHFFFKKLFDVKNQMQHLFETEIFYRVSNQIFVCCESN